MRESVELLLDFEPVDGPPAKAKYSADTTHTVISRR